MTVYSEVWLVNNSFSEMNLLFLGQPSQMGSVAGVCTDN
jgi:hypothetical protein